MWIAEVLDSPQGQVRAIASAMATVSHTGIWLNFTLKYKKILCIIFVKYSFIRLNCFQNFAQNIRKDFLTYAHFLNLSKDFLKNSPNVA